MNNAEIEVKTSKGNPFIPEDSVFQGLRLPMYNHWQTRVSDLLAEGWSEADIALLLAAHYTERGEAFSAKYTLEQLVSSNLVDFSDILQEAEGLLEVVVFFSTDYSGWVKRINPPQVFARDEAGQTFYGQIRPL